MKNYAMFNLKNNKSINAITGYLASIICPEIKECLTQIKIYKDNGPIIGNEHFIDILIGIVENIDTFGALEISMREILEFSEDEETVCDIILKHLYNAKNEINNFITTKQVFK